MNNLYDYLFTQEIKKAEAESGRLRFLIIGVLMTGFILNGNPGSAVVCTLLLVLNLVHLLFRTQGRTAVSPYIFILLETGLVTAGRISIDRADIALSLTVLYLIVLYSSSLQLKDSLILFAGVLVFLSMNLIYLAHLIEKGDVLAGNPLDWPGFNNQIILTLIVLTFTLTLLSRPHSIRRLLLNQQNFIESFSTENQDLFESLDDFCREYALSDRESEVLGILITGKTYRMIATDLFISLDTVKTHIRSIYRKTSSEGKSDLIGKLRNDTLARRTLSD